MPTLLLSSSGKFLVPQNIDQCLPKKMIDSKMAYITTGAKKVSDASFIANHKQQMDEQGLQYTEIDIADKTEDELRKILQGYDIIRVEGGNAFYLLKAVRESGFANVVRELLEKDVVYIGSSAGAYVACPSIIVSTWWNKKYDECGITDYEAMNLVPFLIKAHYKLDQLEMLQEKAKALPYPLRVIDDSQALLVRDGEVSLLGEGEEIIL